MAGAELFADDPRRSYWELLIPLVRTSLPWPPTWHKIDWPAVEAELGVELPESYRKVAEILPAGILGDIWWFSPSSRYPTMRLSMEKLQNHREVLAEVVAPKFPLYPSNPGYLVFATTGWGFDLAYKVNHQDRRTLCLPQVFIYDWRGEELERTSIPIDQLLYRAITNKPALRVELSKSFHQGFTDPGRHIFSPNSPGEPDPPAGSP